MQKEMDNALERAPLLDQIVCNGFAIAPLTTIETKRLEHLYREATTFFELDEAHKLCFSVPDRTSGFRPVGSAHAGSAYLPDLNESFIYWKDDRGLPTKSVEIAPFIDALEAFRLVAKRIAVDLIEELRARYNYDHALSFEKASLLQVNSFDVQTDREFLQLPHEDAILFTVLWANQKGLELVCSDSVVPMHFPFDRMLIMPASVMTLMTGNEIQPLFHQVRNHGFLGRKSVMYFVSPDVTNAIEPFVVNDYNRAIDIREVVIKNPQEHFGLSADFVPVSLVEKL